MLKSIVLFVLILSPVLPQAQSGDDPGKALREASAKVVTAAKVMGSNSDLKTFDRNVDETMKLYYGVGQKDEVRDAVKADLVQAFKAARARSIKAAQDKAKANPPWKALLSMKAELAKRREEALKVIRDESVYLREDHPDYKKGDKANGQARVDQLVLKKNKGSVQEVWEQGCALSVKPESGVMKEVELARRIGDKYLHDLAEDPDDEDLKPLAMYAFLPGGPVSLRSLCSSQEELDSYSWNRAVEKYNEGIQDPAIGPDEKQHAKVMNEYREMMGIRTMYLEPRLCRSAKKHSAVCNAAGNIWHEGSDGTPTSRMKAEGWNEGNGENVLMGIATNDSWWLGWYLASDHHRNALVKDFTCFGYGYVGKVGTQNLGMTTMIPAGMKLK
jgi:hypothetical protein